ncbi:hypothetical protein K445DRAFT_372987 [Daldinia sp. EC12]|nr:hypothetical protein K445DRAFT_372987 [Daldinia sp. EC12]
MAQSSNPTTPIKSSRDTDSFYGSGLDVTFISPVLHVEEKSRNDHFIKYGNHIVIFSLGARSDYVETTFNLLDYVGPVSILINAHMWAHGTCPYEKNDIVQVSGSLGPWSFRAARPNVVTGQESWQAIITTSTPNMIKENDMQPPGLARRRSYSFYIFILLDKTTQKRHAWLVKDKTKIQSGNYVYYSGRVIGQILEQHIIHAVWRVGQLRRSRVSIFGHQKQSAAAVGAIYPTPGLAGDPGEAESLSDMSSLESLSDVFKQNTADRNASLAEDSNDDDEYGPFPDIDDVLGNMEDFQGGTQTTMPSQPHAEQEHEPEYEPEEPEPEPEQASAAQKRNDAEDGQNETGENDGGFRKSKRRRH